MDFLKDLNDTQKQSVEYIEGPLMVIAGAGSGKTRVLTYKIAYLIQRGWKPYNILALTFTNKAAGEMKERIGHLVGPAHAYQVWMGTFHSVFAKILRREADKISYVSNFTIYDTEDSKKNYHGYCEENEFGREERIQTGKLVVKNIGIEKQFDFTGEVRDDVAHDGR